VSQTTELTTERLVLRPFRPDDDLDDAYAYMSDPDVVRYLYWEVRTRDEVRAFLAERGSHVLAVELAADGRVIGEVLLRRADDEHRQGELGYVLNPAYQGKGYAAEAARAMLRAGFEDFGLHRIMARLDSRNKPSAALLERLGMRLEGHFVHDELFKGEWSDTLVYAMLADEWRSRTGA
jgi:RimJ/RimL family protein N-acetyltransferase